VIKVRSSEARGRTRLSWLDSQHSFSFGDYYDPGNVGFRSLRMINEDVVAPGRGFPTHGHRDMEILSYVLAGALQHKDSSGGGGIIRPGEVQFMRAGRGVSHSEYNASTTDPVHFLQIWIVPDQTGLAPAYGQRTFDPARAAAGFDLLASGDGRDGSIALHQDASLSVARPAAGQAREHALRPGRHAWLQVARGEVHANGQLLRKGDGASFSDEASVNLDAAQDSEVLLFDLA
jgi:hypothetical protein